MSLASLLPSWQLESDNKSPKTIKSCRASVRSLAAFLAASDMPAEIDDVTTERRDRDPHGIAGLALPDAKSRDWSRLSVLPRAQARSSRSSPRLARASARLS
jgi:hypothetical protein